MTVASEKIATVSIALATLRAVGKWRGGRRRRWSRDSNKIDGSRYDRRTLWRRRGRWGDT